MTLRLKIFLAAFLALGVLGAFGTKRVCAMPFEEITPDQDIYQRVKSLERYGLLDPQDQAVLDQGKVVTRLELAFYTEKAKARISAPELAEPTPQPAPAETLPPMMAPPVQSAPALPPPVAVPAATPVPAVPPQVRQEIDDLLKQLREESAVLRTRFALDDDKIKQQADELEKLTAAQDEVDSVWKKANKSVGTPHFFTNMKWRAESLSLSGIATENAMRLAQEINFGAYTDLDGKGALSVGLGAVAPLSNASAQPVSVYVNAPSVTYDLYGDLGNWDTTFAVEAFEPATSLGDFTRGVAPYSLKRFEDPFDIKNFSDDKDAKIWDDFMNSVGFVSTTSIAAGNVQSTSDRVFDGIYAVGKNVLGLADDFHGTILIGRMGTTTSQSPRWEEALKLEKPFANNLLRLSLSTIWVNDNFGVNQVPQLDLKDYAGTLGVNLDPVFFNFEAGFSHLYTGEYLSAPTTTALEGGAGQAAMSFYPFNLYYSAISDSYANFQSKVMMAGVHFSDYGESFNANDSNDVYGGIGEVDNLISDRYGWRANLGWNGRQQPWMKSWPSFLDAIVINLDVAQKNEYVDELSPEGYSVVEPFQMLGFYYPEDEGLWGLHFWGGYAGTTYPVRQDYINDIEAIRNDGPASPPNAQPYSGGDDVRYQFGLSSERIPLILPVYSSPGVIQKNGNGFNVYNNLNYLKTYNYITLTTKIQLNKWVGLPTPIFGTFFFTDNQVSGKTATPPVGMPDSISNLFEQKVMDGTFYVNVLPNVDLMGDYGVETWTSQYSYPQVDYRTTSWGVGFAYDIPWGGSRMEWRFKHVDFNDVYVPASNYSGNQVFGTFRFLF